ncbi:hypothetical protein CERSUDRAFT_111931 [Gelatoporia subvermispora B]|uniref:Uncharacterized protein n=1 Tax=Ceriporiopsis subvermispora (strain B) TaxID=914234 RepID=M2RMC1_CERS8|nr:hypothetical protein CERSUDRAFT_111931 [Gelatoporia subvermispora B]
MPSTYADIIVRSSIPEAEGPPESIGKQTVTVMVIAIVVVGAIVGTIYRVGRHKQPEAPTDQTERLARRYPTGRRVSYEPRLDGTMDDIEPLPVYAPPRLPPPAYVHSYPPPPYPSREIS